MYLNDTSAEKNRGTKDFKNQVVVENSLRSQGGSVKNLRQNLNDIRYSLEEVSSKFSYSPYTALYAERIYIHPLNQANLIP